MRHRHLDDPGYSLTAIDDVIERGNLQDWIELAEAADRDKTVVEGIRTIVAARTGDQSTINHDFWRLYMSEMGRPGRTNAHDRKKLPRCRLGSLSVRHLATSPSQ